jgi:pimeloyl-ACP methyl ester carboxylesterase
LGVLILAGSSGRIDGDRARLFARHGATAESIRWFGDDGPCEIPLELFQSRVADLRRSCDRILVVGTSFGSEAALLTGAHTPGVDGVVAFAPSDVVWAGVRPDGSQTSHWTLGGTLLPFISFLADWKPTTDPPIFKPLYELSRAADPAAAEAAAIPAERIAHLILIAGEQDLVWPSAQHAVSLARRRSIPPTVVLDHEAGHRALLPTEPEPPTGQPMARGGTPKANRRLGSAAWSHITRLMHELTPDPRTEPQ